MVPPSHTQVRGCGVSFYGASMKWFKHMTNASDDLFVKDLERRFSHAGYAFWFKTLELLGNHGSGGELQISWANYREKLHMRRTQVEQLLNFCSTSGKLLFTSSDLDLKITCPKFAELSDNYTKYAPRLQSDFKETSKQEVEVEEEVEQKKKKIRYAPPNIADILPYFSELGMTTEDAHGFHDHYEANGWVQGRQGKPIKEWKAAARNWKRNKEKFNANSNGRSGNGNRQSEQIARATFEHGPEDAKRFRELEETLRLRVAK